MFCLRFVVCVTLMKLISCNDSNWTCLVSNATHHPNIGSDLRAAKPSTTRYVEVLMVGDHGLYTDFFNSSLENVSKFMTELINVANEIAAGIKVEFVLYAIEVWTEREEIPVGPYFRNRTFLWHNYSIDNYWNKYKYDVAMLIEGRSYPGGRVGFGQIGQVCRPYGAGHVSYARRFGPDSFRPPPMSVLARVFAHEVGHILGLEHDTDVCNCPSGKYRCVMGRDLTDDWSDCSIAQLNEKTKNAPKGCYDYPNRSRFDGRIVDRLTASTSPLSWLAMTALFIVLFVSIALLILCCDCQDPCCDF